MIGSWRGFARGVVGKKERSKGENEGVEGGEGDERKEEREGRKRSAKESTYSLRKIRRKGGAVRGRASVLGLRRRKEANEVDENGGN